MRQIEPGTDAADQDVEISLPRQLRQALGPHADASRSKQRIIEWSNNRVGMAQGHNGSLIRNYKEFKKPATWDDDRAFWNYPNGRFLPADAADETIQVVRDKPRRS